MSYKAVLFDLDGTLINTLHDLATCVNTVLSEKGFPTHKLNAYRFFVGEGAIVLIRRALPKGEWSDSLIKECHEMFMRVYRQNCGKEAFLYEGIPELLNELTQRRLKLCVLSNKPHELTIKSISELLSNWKFDIVLGQRDNVPRKPDPAGAVEIANHLNMTASDFLYLGDTAIDMKTSIAAGMFPVGALWGFRDRKELLQNGAQKLIEKPIELLELLD
jgi:phosphoglycolate phosphatase